MRAGASRLLLPAAGIAVAVAILLAAIRPLSVAAGFVSGVALGGASAGSLVLLGRAFVTNLTRPRSSALMALQFAKWPVLGALIYLLVVHCQVDGVALAVGYGAAMLVGLRLAVSRPKA